MSVKFNKNGVISADNIFESDAKNLVIESDIGKTYSYTPTTGVNSCITGFTVDYSNCTAGEKIYARIKVEWSGFDTSNTAGKFAMWFQGATYNVTTDAWEWTGNNIVPAYLGSSVTNLILSKESGSAIVEVIATVPSVYPGTKTKENVGLRSDYSNGKGTISISDLVVVQEKYYTPSSSLSNSGPAIKIAEDYVVSNELYEI